MRMERLVELANSYLSMRGKIKFINGLFNLYSSVLILILIWFLSSNNFIFATKSLQEHVATMTVANATSFKVITINSSAKPSTNVVSHKVSSQSSKSSVTAFTNVAPHKLTSTFFNVISTAFVSKLPQTLLPFYTITNANGTLSERILSANNTFNHKGSFFQQPLPKTIHGTTDPPPA